MAHYLVPCVVVQRTASRQHAMTGTGVFQSKHDRLATASGAWRMDLERAGACVYMLLATDGRIVDVGRILRVDAIPSRWVQVSPAEEAEGFRPIDADRVVLAITPQTPPAIESLIGQAVTTGRNPVRYVTARVEGSRATIVQVDDTT